MQAGNLLRAIPAMPIFLIGQSVFQNRLKVTHITTAGKTTWPNHILYWLIVDTHSKSTVLVSSLLLIFAHLPSKNICL